MQMVESKIKRYVSLVSVVGVALACLLASQQALAGPVVGFQGLGVIPPVASPSSGASGVSADGAVVVGVANSGIGTAEAFRWTSAGGMVGLGDLPGGSFFSTAYAVSADGSTVVGQGQSVSGFEAFRWSSAGGMVGLGDLPGGNFFSLARDTSGDGSVVVGSGHSSSGGEAFRWTNAGGMVGLGDLPGGNFFSSARATSSDGSVVVGLAESSSGGEAFRWTNAGGMFGLGDLPGGSFSSESRDTSADGSVVVGSGNSASGREAFSWTASGGMVGLGDLPGGLFDSRSFATSADGSVIVGRGETTSGPEAFMWTAGGGMRSLQELLTSDLGLDLTGWQLEQAFDVSADGRTIVGTGINPNGIGEAFIVTIPEPTTVLLVGLGLAWLLVNRGRRNRQIQGIGVATLLSCGIQVTSAQTVTGMVMGNRIKDTGVICGQQDAADTCMDGTLETVPLEGVLVRVQNGTESAYTDQSGQYTIPYSGSFPVTLEADLVGKWSSIVTRGGVFECFDNNINAFTGQPCISGNFGAECICNTGICDFLCVPALAPAPPIEVIAVSANAPDLVFNATMSPLNEFETASVNVFSRLTELHGYFKALQPTYTVIDESLEAQVMMAASFLNYSLAPLPRQVQFGGSGPNQGGTNVNFAIRSYIAWGYGAFAVCGPVAPCTSTPGLIGLIHAFAILAYDDPFIGFNFNGAGAIERNYDFTPPPFGTGAPRKQWEDPCNSPEASDCAEALGGAWWDIKLNLQAKYSAPGAPSCPMAGIIDGNECGLELTRQLLSDVIVSGTHGDISTQTPTFVLLADDDPSHVFGGDGDVSTETPHYDEICDAFVKHGIPCPHPGCANLLPYEPGVSPDCNDNFIHDACDSILGFSSDCNEDFVPDECELASGAIDSNHDGILDECQSCPPIVTAIDLAVLDPPSGTIDARQPHPIGDNGPGSLQGIGSPNVYTDGPEPITVTLNPPVSGADMNKCWGLCESPMPNTNQILNVDETSSGVYEILLKDPIASVKWTTLYYVPTLSEAAFASLPGDVNASKVTNAQDVTAMINCLNGLPGVCDKYRTDLNHSEQSNPQDITALINLLNGAGTFSVWNGASIMGIVPCTFGGGAPLSGGESSAIMTTTSIVSEEDANAAFIDDFVIYLTTVRPVTVQDEQDLEAIVGAVANWCKESFPVEDRRDLARKLRDPRLTFADNSGYLMAQWVIDLVSP